MIPKVVFVIFVILVTYYNTCLGVLSALVYMVAVLPEDGGVENQENQKFQDYQNETRHLLSKKLSYEKSLFIQNIELQNLIFGQNISSKKNKILPFGFNK